ncbi:alpha/beta hydrolase family protein [Hymenobacter sp. BT491]|uniref:alpha/beta hydrolase family protein n=1 Tax=Hymenobacter sp. BT491 TaxID=2766779 RepID=UPI0016535598|nr:alpha/beta fold hydrolase [Hymenobacter sp. BT491]MBC6991342.1 alpha/beta fold hydrolase [Hymenobacter sp. BT491]
MRLTFSLSGCLVALLLASAPAAFGQRAALPNLTGQWTGSLRIPTGSSLQLLLHMRDANGRRSATLDIPTQDVQDVAVDRVESRGDSVLLFLTDMKAQFAGRLAPDGRQLKGTWRQNNARLPLMLQRESAEPTPAYAKGNARLKRPQEPVPPLPYRSEEVRFSNANAGVQLAGTLTLPPGKGPFPVAVLLTGSGPQDRDEAVFGHRPFLVIADYLTRQGLAVLRFDDRGVGQSTGDSKNVTAVDYAQDAQAAMTYLRSRPDINSKQIGLIGHSEGGAAGVRTAAQGLSPAFLVLLGTAGLPGSEVAVRQALDMARFKTSDPNVLANVEKRQRAAIQVVQRTLDNAQAQEQIVKIMLPDIPLPAEQANQLKAVVHAQAATMTTPAFRFLLSDNPQQTLRAVKCPVLALIGSKDLQVAPDANLQAIDKALKASGNRDVTVRELPGLNHMFQTATTGNIAEYSQIQETVSPVALRTMSDWLIKHVR